MEQRIKFVDADYREIFSIKDGGKIKMVFPDGLTVTHICRYVDDLHIQVGINIFDKFEFARACKEDGATIVPVEE